VPGRAAGKVAVEPAFVQPSPHLTLKLELEHHRNPFLELLWGLTLSDCPSRALFARSLIASYHLTSENITALIETEPAASPEIWVLELDNGDDSRLTSTLITRGLIPAMHVVEREWRALREAAIQQDAKKNPNSGAPGALVIVGRRSQDKFFSNG
jgi:hypothetical protein